MALYREEEMQGELEGANILKELLGCGIWDKSLVGGEGAAWGGMNGPGASCKLRRVYRKLL